jgi:endonuclease-3
MTKEKSQVNKKIERIIEILKKETKKFKEPAVSKISRKKRNPYLVLISTLLSLRTKDDVTLKASTRLFKLADNPYDIVKLDKETIEKAIYPVGFYHRKAEQILNISKELIEKYNGEVPSLIEKLLSLKGVGRKTANLVLSESFNIKGIAVDTHVHRISNRIGLVNTKNPKETEFELMKILPEKYWTIFNKLLVTLGQNICTPISPKCSICPINVYCKKVKVKRSR